MLFSFDKILERLPNISLTARDRTPFNEKARRKCCSIPWYESYKQAKLASKLTPILTEQKIKHWLTVWRPRPLEYSKTSPSSVKNLRNSPGCNTQGFVWFMGSLAAQVQFLCNHLSKVGIRALERETVFPSHKRKEQRSKAKTPSHWLSEHVIKVSLPNYYNLVIFFTAWISTYHLNYRFHSWNQLSRYRLHSCIYTENLSTKAGQGL